MGDDLEARLQSHARAFDGLMSLLPPELYYGKQDTHNEWKKKKQTKAEKKAAKRAKLDPANHKTAKDVADERDRKRRLEDGDDDVEGAELTGDVEKPGEGLKQPKAKAQKTAKDQDVHSKKVEAATTKAERRKEKEQRKKEKQEKKKAKSAEKKAKNEAAAQGDSNEDGDEDVTEGGIALDAEIELADFSGLQEDGDRRSSSRSASPDPEFTPQHANGTISSTSSLEQLSDNEAPSKQNKIDPFMPPPPPKHEVKAPREELLARLKAKIEERRKARKADGIDGKPARGRTELLESRRRQAQAKKEKKRELRAHEREELKKQEMEAHLASLRGSPQLGASLFSPRSRSASILSPMVESNNFSFGRVAWADGTRLNNDLNGLEEARRKKGPQDAKTALQLAEKKAARISSFDPEKRADIEEKDVWLNARKHVAGEKVKDDISSLKKSVKRKEKMKQKSEKQWDERIEGVQKSQYARQKKREENIRKRKEEKGGKGKKTGAKKTGKKKARPGFEGTFRGRS